MSTGTSWERNGKSWDAVGPVFRTFRLRSFSVRSDIKGMSCHDMGHIFHCLNLLYLDNLVFRVGMVVNFIVEMYKGSLDIVESFEALLKRLSNIVRLHEVHVGRKNNIDFDEKVAAKVERTNRVDVRHLGVVVYRYPGQLLEEVWSRCVTRQHLNLLW
jgi:hypothetical protein